MPNTKTAKARDITNERNRKRNLAVNSRMKTYLKEALSALEAKDVSKVNAVLQRALSEIDRAAAKGVIHPNSASRKKSSLQRRAAALSKS
jgi:small subunit ribosomal protein S20